MVSLVCDYYQVLHGAVTIGCDGAKALHRVFSQTFTPTLRDAHFDLLIAMRTIIESTGIDWSSQWVKGHQDEDPFGTLDDWARLNIEMDTRAKIHWEHHHLEPSHCQLRVKGEPWTLWIRDHKVCHQARQKIIDHVQGSEGRKWWLTHAQLPDTLLCSIDWGASGTALKSSRCSRWHWVVKHSSGFCGVGQMMARWKKWPTAECPRCGDPCKTTRHVWKCSGENANLIWTAALDRLRTWLLSQGTAPEVCEAIHVHLSLSLIHI